MRMALAATAGAGLLALGVAVGASASGGAPTPVAAIEGEAFSGQLGTYQRAVSGDELWVEQVYRDLLGREASASELALEVAQLSEGATRAEVALQILGGSEYRGDFVTSVYQRFLGRAASSGEVSFALAYLGSGGSDEGLEAQVLGSSEYYLSAGGGTIDGFLSALYAAVLGRPIDATAEALFGSELTEGFTRDQVALQVLTSTEARDDLIDGWYVRFLGHHADATGLAYFGGVLGSGGTDEEVIAAIVGSLEYYTRLQPPPPTASIDWGDGTAASTGTISTLAANDLYAIGGAHTYAEEGSYKVTVTVDDLGTATTIETVATVADAPLTASGVTLALQLGRPFKETVATFADANPGAATSDFTAAIDWGDLKTSPGTVESLGGGRFAVIGAHAYPHRGSYAVSVQVDDAGGATASAKATITVAPGKPG
jgi:Domain of unknown function (DUF4214)